jgi:hypothetical protein
MTAEIMYAIELFHRLAGEKLTYDFTKFTLGREAICVTLCGIFMFLGRDKNELKYSHVLMVIIPLVLVAIVYLRFIWLLVQT